MWKRIEKKRKILITIKRERKREERTGAFVGLIQRALAYPDGLQNLDEWRFSFHDCRTIIYYYTCENLQWLSLSRHFGLWCSLLGKVIIKIKKITCQQIFPYTIVSMGIFLIFQSLLKILFVCNIHLLGWWSYFSKTSLVGYKKKKIWSPKPSVGN